MSGLASLSRPGLSESPGYDHMLWESRDLNVRVSWLGIEGGSDEVPYSTISSAVKFPDMQSAQIFLGRIRFALIQFRNGNPDSEYTFD